MIAFGAIIALFTGLGLFMAGVQTLRHSLAHLIQGRVLSTMQNLQNRYIAATFGTVGATVMHSSGTIVTLAIGLVNTGGLSLMMAGAIILGANIGTTVTGLTASSGVSSFGNIFGLFVLVRARIGIFRFRCGFG
jgi:phosphate:Na+ symporter